MIYTSSCAHSARFATCARSSLRSQCLHAFKVRLIVILCCGVVYDCSHTAEIDMHHVVMKGVTCYKDASEHDGYCNGNSGAHVQGGGQLDVTS